MDDDVQAIDPPVPHMNGAGSFSLPSTIPDLEANSGIPGFTFYIPFNFLYRFHPTIVFKLFFSYFSGGVIKLTQQAPQSKYAQLLAVIEDMGKDIRPTYAGSKSSAERLKRGIVHARILVRECLLETERSARQ